MPTLTEVASTVADMLARSDLTASIKAEIKHVCRDYAREPGFLTEQREGTFSTVADQQWYATVDFSSASGAGTLTSTTNVDQILRIQYAKLDPGASGLDERLLPIHYLEFEALNEGSSTSSWPTYFTLHSHKIGLWPIPSQVFTVYLSAFVKPVVPDADSDESPFFDYALDLVENATAGRVCRKYMQDYEQASIYMQAEKDQWTRLMGETARKATTGRTRARW